MSESSEPDILFEGAEWFDQNKGKLLNGALIIIVAVVGWQLISKNLSESKATSESALFDIQTVGETNLSEVAKAYNRVSVEQAGKPVAERALILSAKTWLEVSDYDKAQVAFKNYIDNYADGHWAVEALLGQAICKEAKGDVAGAISTYQSLTNDADTAIKSRATALLEAAKVQLEPLAAKPIPAPVVQPETPKPGPSTSPPAPVVTPDNK
ncbi:MAG: tetratricopeptide repeat protein [Verrucomicrobiota bacterium]|jgi:hypothetical protein|nr:tetratricopeptide repeat protein [Verrucomicrobiota bacterium]MDP7047930.1 tetratricopeptide repeat protein [Verrucomicrobiota bacterium]